MRNFAIQPDLVFNYSMHTQLIMTFPHHQVETFFEILMYPQWGSQGLNEKATPTSLPNLRISQKEEIKRLDTGPFPAVVIGVGLLLRNSWLQRNHEAVLYIYRLTYSIMVARYLT